MTYSSKPRGHGRYTESQHWTRIRSCLRREFIKWPPRGEALKQARVPYKGENKRRKWLYKCNICAMLNIGTEVQVDHITPVGSLKSADDLPGFTERLFCEIDELQVLCKPCHKKITQQQREKK